MSGESVLTVVATILALGSGTAQIDRGFVDGLRPGDVGTIFYSLSVGGERKRIEAGAAEVEAVAEHSARVGPPAGGELREGYGIEFALPVERLAPEAVLAAARQHLEGPALDRFLAEWVAKVIPDDLAVEERLLAELMARAQQRGGEPTTQPDAPALLPAAPAPAPAAPGAGAAAPATMVRIAGGSYAIGVPLDQAKFYNQQPRFDVRLDAFWVDERPVGALRFREFRPDYQVPPEANGEFAVGVTYEEAERFCRFHGKRLPSEFEWEVAVQTPGVAVAAGVLEWTSSWYLPYPGNEVQEPEYGAGFKVLRAGTDGDLRARSFLQPAVRQAVVGFRCAVGELGSAGP